MVKLFTLNPICMGKKVVISLILFLMCAENSFVQPKEPDKYIFKNNAVPKTTINQNLCYPRKVCFVWFWALTDLDLVSFSK